MKQDILRGDVCYRKAFMYVCPYIYKYTYLQNISEKERKYFWMNILRLDFNFSWNIKCSCHFSTSVRHRQYSS